MKLLSPAKVNKEIERRKKLFAGATKAQKRVLIAKDVLQQIALKKIKLASHSFFDIGGKRNELRNGESVQVLLLNNEIPRCECCALGALMVSCTMFNNKEKVSDIPLHFEGLGWVIKNGKKLGNKLTEIFSGEQLVTIEQAFEQGAGYFCGFGSNAAKWGGQYKAKGRRLTAIAKNIIKNKGEFIPVFKEAA